MGIKSRNPEAKNSHKIQSTFTNALSFKGIVYRLKIGTQTIIAIIFDAEALEEKKTDTYLLS